MPKPRYWFVVGLLLLFLPCVVVAQSSLTSTVTGTVTDPSGAVVPKATVELKDVTTTTTRTATTNDSGQYIFTNVAPGSYTIAAKAQGFKTATANLRVEIARSHAANMKLEVGEVSAVVEVRATGNELQTLDASVGNVISQNDLANMPTLNRDATSLLLLQPMAIPGFNTAPGTGSDNLTGGSVAGARSDQNTFLIDGGDASSNTEGGGGYNTGFTATPRAVVPTPTESLEELRVTTNNPNATFNQSSGAAVQMVTKRGTNDWHGAGYFYHQNDALNANTWTRNLIGQPNPEMRDNRFGARVGGPIFKDHTFFFVHYEGRRFLRNEDFTRAVPTQEMRNGLLRFPCRRVNPNDPNSPLAQVDPAVGCNNPGDIGTYNVATLDPRAIGMSPVIQNIWNNFMPLDNDCTSAIGDGLNTCVFTAPVPFVVNEDFAVARLDHRFKESWNFTSSFRYATTEAASTAQVDIGGFSGGTLGVPVAANRRPLEPRYLVVGLSGNLTSNITTDFRFNWLRHWWQWQALTPTPQDPGTAAALAIAGESRTGGLVPVNVDTQNARSRTWNGQDYTFSSNTNWLAGKHLFQFGGRYTRQNFFHQRDDKVVGGLAVPVYQVLDGGDVTINTLPNTVEPGDAARFQNFFATMLGIVNRGSQLLVRDAQFGPLPPGTPINQYTRVNNWQLYGSDTWRVTPSFTLTYGLTWSLQMPPFEQNRKDTVMVDNATDEVLDFRTILSRRAEAALNGQIYNPELAFAQSDTVGRKYPYDPQYGLFGPRLAIAWNPSYTDGFLGSLMGDRLTAVRAGYSRVFDRVNGVGIVMTPALGIGYGNGVTCRGPRSGGGCGGPAGNTESTAFRIGVDGSSIPIPTALSPVSGGRIIPGFTANANSPYELLDFRIDPARKVGVEEMWDLSIQRELPWRSMIEVGYMGRVGYHLPHGIAINHVPYMFTLNGQTFADAYDVLAAACRSNFAACENGTLVVPNQPFFQHAAFTSLGNTAGVLAGFPFELLDGRVNDIWSVLEGSIDPVNGTTGTYNQVYDGSWTVSDGRSNYHAGFITFRKKTSAGLNFQVNYTLAKSLDYVGLTQENVFEASDPYNLKRDYGPSLFDRRHVLNFYYNYDIPIGRGRSVNIENGVLDRIIGGWSMSGIFTAASGLPYDVPNFSGCQEFGQGGVFGNCTAMVSTTGETVHSSRREVNGEQNAFADPNAVLALFRRPLFSDQRTGRGLIRGQNRWAFDFGLAKTIPITERVRTRIDAQFINIFNNPQLTDPDLDFTGGAFGTIGPTQYNSPRFIQVGLRIEF